MNTGSDMGGGKNIKILIINYGAGNLKSVANAFELLGAKTDVVNVSNLNKGLIDGFDAVVLPGVGNFDTFAKAIKGKEKIFRNLKKPFLGICLGLQILMGESEEAKDVKGIGLIKGKNIKFKGVKVPHIGWNEVDIIKAHSVLDGLNNKFFYFVHSYYADPKSKECIFATCNYGVDFPAVIIKENFISTQFHPEKSGEAGIKFLENFMNWSTECKGIKI